MEDEDRLTRYLRDLHYIGKSTCAQVTRRVWSCDLTFAEQLSTMRPVVVAQILVDLLQLRKSDRIVFTDLDCGGVIHPLKSIIVSVNEL